MKVCFYFGIFARNGGIEVFTRDLGLALLKTGVSVEVICASLKHHLLDELEDAGAKIVRVPVYWGCRWNIPDFFLFPVALGRLTKCDVVIHRKPLLKQFYRWLPRTAKHVYITAYRPSEQFPDKEKRKSFFSWFDYIITQTAEFESDLKLCSIAKAINVMPHIPPATYCPEIRNSNSRTLRIGLLGRLEPQKNIPYAFEVVNELSNQLPEEIDSVELHINGTGSLELELREQAKRYDFDTIFHGRYKRADIPSRASECDCFLIPSTSEGQCIVALEILAGGRPLFATPVGALPEILQDRKRGELIPQGDPVTAASLIITWLDESRELTVSDIHKSYFRSFDREEIKRSYVDLICGMAEKK